MVENQLQRTKDTEKWNYYPAALDYKAIQYSHNLFDFIMLYHHMYNSFSACNDSVIFYNQFMMICALIYMKMKACRSRIQSINECKMTFNS